MSNTSTCKSGNSTPILPLELRGIDLDLVKVGFDIYLKVWNIVVTSDRQGNSLEWDSLLPIMDKELAETAVSDWAPFICEAVQEYRNRRSKANGPLRYKKEGRLSTIPLAGNLARMHPGGSAEIRARRLGESFFITAIEDVEKQ